MGLVAIDAVQIALVSDDEGTQPTARIGAYKIFFGTLVSESRLKIINLLRGGIKNQTAQVKITAIIQARMGSTRLPGKVLMEVGGKTVLAHLIDRLKCVSFIDEIVAHHLVSGIRLNTVMPLKDSKKDNLKRLQDLAGYKDLWIDLKCRQLRVKTYGIPPFTEVELSHTISVDTPTTAYFPGGKEGKIHSLGGQGV